MNIVQWIAIAVAVAFLFQVFFFTGKHKMRDKEAFFWILIGAVGLLVALMIPFLNTFAGWIGISYMPTFVFMLAFFVTLTILIYQTTVLSSQQEKVKNLIQELAYMKKEMESMREEMERKGEKQHDAH
jgi:hypothetical protein